MPATVIGVKGLSLGFIGNISNEGYSLRTPRQVRPTDTFSVAFGETFVLNGDNTYSSVKTYLQTAGGVIIGTGVGSTPIGIAASNVNINPAYVINGSNDVLTPGGVYLPGAIMDGLVQGTINVSCNNGTPTAGGTVYMRTAIDATITAGVVGGLEALTDPNPVTTTGATTGASTALTLGSGTGVTQGMGVSGTNIVPGSFLLSGTGTAWVLSIASLGTVSGNVVLTHNTNIDNFKWKTGYLETDLTAQVTILRRSIA